MTNETIPYVTRNLRHLLAAPNLTEAQRTIITRTLATLSEVSAKQFPEHQAERPTIDDMLADPDFMRKVNEASRKYARPSSPYIRMGTGIMHRNADEMLRKSIEKRIEQIEGGR